VLKLAGQGRRRARRRSAVAVAIVVAVLSAIFVATPLEAVDWIRQLEALGAGEILLTSMDRDGTRAGYDLELTRTIADAVSVPVIASGGVGSLDDLVEGVRQGHASAVLAASIFHFGEATIHDAKARLAAAGIAVRV